jgi:hypothetical protein
LADFGKGHFRNRFHVQCCGDIQKIMNTIWFTLAIQGLKLLRWYYGKLTPEEKKEFSKRLIAWKKQIKDMPMPEPPPLEGR